ncbi:molybdopterin molybdenumtransferase MoeA [Salipiger sp. IMCC34102]|uniref:molybdopterin molybdotransferase MoeA n=1 Tax=Salipiger sp. IMCC34102 TaxID=2510647 RepID=UPI00101C0352|nr:gephyrin-like molybdotransferase Glp [Salipiger sp. IMCC34102]RYH03025.1 molybdopterin molybdenumtransferase MoeA [Salipiger sp. IMCC34102]
MIPVAQALDALFALVTPLGSEDVPLREAAGRVLSRDVAAARTQPPFPASAMDGYALTGARPRARFRVIGESAAGHRFTGPVAAGEAVRIFTGAPVPEGCDRVVIQEDTTRAGDTITLHDDLDPGPYIRPAGTDFRAGDTLSGPRQLTPSDIALLAAMNVARVPVVRRPVVALIATGDELVQPGEDPGPDQIIASNSYGLDALLRAQGAEVRMLPIARDRVESLALCLDLARDADLIVTIGGASVGDHDLVAQAAQTAGMERVFYKVAMRPGKPLMAGRLGRAAMIGLPGNPVSAMVCGHVFLRPVLRAFLGLGTAALPRRPVTLAAAVGANGGREHYARAQVEGDRVTVFERQDSALLSVLSQANALAVRPPGDRARQAGEAIEVIDL